MNLTLTANQPFSFLSVVRSHGWAQLAPFRWNSEAQILGYTLRLQSGMVVDLIIQHAPGGLSLELDDVLDQEEQEEIFCQVGWMFGLHQDFSAFYAATRQEPKLVQVEERAQGRLLRSPSLFEDVVKTILTTNTLWQATIRMTHNLVQQFGDPLPGNPERKAFPTPASIANSNEETLRAKTRLGYRAPYLLVLSQQVNCGELDLEILKDDSLPTPELRKRLLAVKGVGAYAAANLLLLLGRYDYLPVDSWAIKMVSQEWHDGQPVTSADVERAFERWGHWKALAYNFWDWEAS